MAGILDEEMEKVQSSMQTDKHMLISKWRHQILKLSKLDECKLKTKRVF